MCLIIVLEKENRKNGTEATFEKKLADAEDIPCRIKSSLT